LASQQPPSQLPVLQLSQPSKVRRRPCCCSVACLHEGSAAARQRVHTRG
jgi:hypothetical protein